MTDASPTQPPAGWYRQPPDAPSLRWWDGRQWTDHRTGLPADGTTMPPPPPGYGSHGSAAADGLEPSSAAPIPPKPLEQHLLEEAHKFKGYTSIFTILALLGAVGLGWVAAQDTACDISSISGFSCESETDGGTFAIVGLMTFIWSMLFILPLRGLASLLAGVSRLLAQSEE